jgi:hypothetical protein
VEGAEFLPWVKSVSEVAPSLSVATTKNLAASSGTVTYASLALGPPAPPTTWAVLDGSLAKVV